jgi:hypothetical protein
MREIDNPSVVRGKSRQKRKALHRGNTKRKPEAFSLINESSDLVLSE